MKEGLLGRTLSVSPRSELEEAHALLHAGLDLSRRRLDVCLVDDAGELIARIAAAPVSDLFGHAGRELLERLAIPDPWRRTVDVSLRLIDDLEPVTHVGPLYHQFRDKDALVLATLDWVHETWYAEVGSVFEEDLPPMEALVELAGRHAVYCRRDIARVMVALRASTRSATPCARRRGSSSSACGA